MARHTRRLIVWICGSILALILLALLILVLVVLTVDPDRFRGRIETAASGAIGRSVRLTGELHWSLGWRTAIESRGGQIDNAPGFGSEPFAAWQALRFGVAVLPLLRRELRLSRIELDGLRLRLQRDATGAANWNFTPPQQAAAGESDLKIQVGSLALRDAAVSFQDAGTGRDLQFTALKLDVQLPQDPTAPRLMIEGLSLSGQASGVPFAAPGVPFAMEAGEIDFDRAAGTVSVPEWTLRWAEAQAEGSVQARTMPGMAVQGRLSLNAPSLRALLASVSFVAPQTRDPSVFGPVRLVAHADWHDGVATVDELEVKLDATSVTGRVDLPKLAPLALRFELSADQVDVDRYLEPEDAGGEPFELPLAALKELDAIGVLIIQEARMAGAAARELRIDVE